MPGWLVYDLVLMYAMFQEKGLVATAAQLDETRAILGREPTTTEQFIEETAAAWTAS